MGLELDTLKNDGACVIHNNTTGVITGGFVDIKTFKEELFQEWRIGDDHIKNYFDLEDLDDFFSENGLDYERKQLEEIFK